MDYATMADIADRLEAKLPANGGDEGAVIRSNLINETIAALRRAESDEICS